MSALSNTSRKRSLSALDNEQQQNESTLPVTKKPKLSATLENATANSNAKNEAETKHNKPKSSKLSASSLLEFAYLIGNLKKTERTGWIRKGVAKPESVADHMYRMSILSWVFGEQFEQYSREQAVEIVLDKNKVIKMALCHDIIEAICGDIVPIEKVSGISKQKKHEIELAAMLKIRDEYLKHSRVGQEMYDLWIEYEEGSTLEAKLVKDLDKLDMIIQANEYEMDAADKQSELDLSEFFSSTRNVFQTEIGKTLDKHLMEQRQQRLSEEK